MAETSEKPVTQGQHIDIPAHAATRVTLRNDNAGRALWASGGGLLVFIMAASVPILPLALVVLLYRQPEVMAAGLQWVWITIGVVAEMIAFLVAYGMVRSVLEAER